MQNAIYAIDKEINSIESERMIDMRTYISVNIYMLAQTRLI